MYPSTGGYPVLTRSEPVDTRLAGYALALLRELQWEGIAQVDFLHDPKSGRVALLEVNGRIWASIEVAILAGLDFPWYVWQVRMAGRRIFPRAIDRASAFDP